MITEGEVFGSHRPLASFLGIYNIIFRKVKKL